MVPISGKTNYDLCDKKECHDFDYRKRFIYYVNNLCMCGGILDVFAWKVYAVHRAVYNLIV